jgi:protease I
LSRARIDELQANWFEALDHHLPVERLLPMLADEDLDMRFPDVTINGHADFEAWYDDVSARFFDERHEVYADTVRVETVDRQARLRFVVGWQASWWRAPEARSRRVAMDVRLQWVVRASSASPAGIEIVTYDAAAEPFAFAPGSSRLPPPTAPAGGSHARARRYRRVPWSLDTRGENYEMPDFGETAPDALEHRRIVIISADGPELPEIDVPLNFLRSQGAAVEVAGQDWIFQYRDPPGYIIIGQWLADEICLRADLRLSEVRVGEYDAVFIPGGAWNPDMLRADEQALRIVREAREQGVLIVSLCHGPQVLIDAASCGAAFPPGTHVTGVGSIRQDLRNAGFAVHDDDPVVFDKPAGLLTARDPRDLGPLCKEFARQLKMSAGRTADGRA